MKILISLSFLLLLFFSSCTIESTMHFNKDYSGNATSSFDLDQLMQFAGSFSSDDETTVDSLMMMFDPATMPDSIRTSYDSLRMMMEAIGFSDFAFSPEGSKVNMTYSFDDLEVFEQENVNEKIEEAFGSEAYAGMRDEDFATFFQAAAVERDGKWMIFDLTASMGEFTDKIRQDMNNYDEESVTDEEKKTEEASEEFAYAMMEGMMSMFEIKQSFSFDRKIKAIECPISYESDKHSVTLDYSMADIMDYVKESNEENVYLKVRLK